MSLFENLGNNNQQQHEAANLMQMLNELKRNPAAFISKAGFSIPDGMNSPQQIISHLLQSGQVTQDRYAQAMRMMQGKR